MPDTSYQRLKFEKAIAYLRDKLGIGSDRWNSLWNEIQDYVFSIAGVESALVLQAVQDKLVQILEGRSPSVDTFKDFANTFQQTMQAAGYGKQTPWRTRLVYTTNIRQAYNAGRYQQAIAEDHPNEYVQYWHGHPIEARPAHVALHQRVFRKDDPILKTIAPSNGWGCTCRILSLSDRDLKREDLKVAEPLTETITLKDRITGKTIKVPAITVDGVKHPIAEPGFTTAPGASQNKEEVLRSALERLSPKLRSQAEATIKARYPDFSELDFSYNPEQPRDKNGRFAKSVGSQDKARSVYKAIASPRKGSAEYDGIRSQLSDWVVAGRQLEKIAPDIYRSNSGIVGSIADGFNTKHQQFRAVMDDEGEMQAAGLVSKGKQWLIVQYLATSPFNMYGKDAKRGAGTALMASFIKESIDKGFDGRIKLFALAKAVPFYEKIGFKATNPRDGISKTMELSPEDAHKFLSRFESNFSEQTDAEYLAELEKLEQDAGFILAIASPDEADTDASQPDELNFSYNPEQPRDENGRFAKKNGAVSLAKEWADGKTKQLHKEQKDQFAKDPELAKTLILSGTNKTYEQIFKEDGADAAQKALDHHFQKVATRQAKKSTPTDAILKDWDKATKADRLKQAIADERQNILDNGGNRDKQELAAFERMRPKLVGKTTLSDYKAKKGEDLKKAIAEYEREVELDKVLKYDAVMERGDRITQKLKESLDKPLEPEYQKLIEKSKAELIAKGIPEQEAHQFVESAIKGVRDKGRMAKFREQITKEHGISKEEASKIVDEIDFSEVKTKERSQLRDKSIDFFQLTGGRGADTLKRYIQKSERAYASEYFESIDIGKKPKDSTVFHEHGHHFEYSDPRIAAAAVEWRDRRATGETTPLNKITGTKAFDENEMGVPGRYIYPYVGKVYATGHTEVVSVGLEAFHNESTMLLLWNKDPDHFKFIVGLLSAKDRG